MIRRLGTLLSALGVLICMLWIAVAVREYRAGASVLWVVGGAINLVIVSYTLVRDVRQLRAGSTA